MEDILLIDAVERFINGEMSPQEKIYFEDLRKNNPELDQAVVEQLFFLNELKTYGATKNFRHLLNEVELKLVNEEFISKTPDKQPSKIVQLWKKYQRITAVAASIAGLVSILIASLVSSVTNSTKISNLNPLVQKINAQEKKTVQIENKLNILAAQNGLPGLTVVKPKIKSTFRATGFMIDADNNYIVTNAHVVNEAKNSLIIENNKGEQYSAKTIYVSKEEDIAILQVTDKDFKKLAALPYSIRKKNAELGEQVFMLGFPKQEVVYGEGFVSAKNGYEMDTSYCQLSTTANEGNSGSPVLTKSGDLIGIITSMELNSDGVVFASKASNIYRAIEQVKKMKNHADIKVESGRGLRGLDREKQIKKMEDYVFMIQGN